MSWKFEEETVSRVYANHQNVTIRGDDSADNESIQIGSDVREIRVDASSGPVVLRLPPMSEFGTIDIIRTDDSEGVVAIIPPLDTARVLSPGTGQRAVYDGQGDAGISFQDLGRQHPPAPAPGPSSSDRFEGTPMSGDNFFERAWLGSHERFMQECTDEMINAMGVPRALMSPEDIPIQPPGEEPVFTDISLVSNPTDPSARIDSNEHYEEDPVLTTLLSRWDTGVEDGGQLLSDIVERVDLMPERIRDEFVARLRNLDGDGVCLAEGISDRFSISEELADAFIQWGNVEDFVVDRDIFFLSVLRMTDPLPENFRERFFESLIREGGSSPVATGLASRLRDHYRNREAPVRSPGSSTESTLQTGDLTMYESRPRALERGDAWIEEVDGNRVMHWYDGREILSMELSPTESHSGIGVEDIVGSVVLNTNSIESVNIDTSHLEGATPAPATMSESSTESYPNVRVEYAGDEGWRLVVDPSSPELDEEQANEFAFLCDQCGHQEVISMGPFNLGPDTSLVCECGGQALPLG